MNKITKIVMSLFVVSLVTVFFATVAQAAPMVKNYEGISYISGGVGIDARQGLQTMAKDYNLKMVFAAKSGNYIADTHVVIKNTAGKTVLDAVSDGPWFYAKLPTGHYTITATTAGKSENQKVAINSAGHMVRYFYWADNLVCQHTCLKRLND
jgi:hypothetical protein